MARILIGWEFGANRGHAVRMSELAAALQAEGHEIVFAMQRLDALTPEQALGAPVWQAPLTPRLLVTVGRTRHGPPAGMADILARLGMDDSALTAAVLRGWRHLFAAVKPDVVLGDFAPNMQMAAYGRIPVVAVGTGFALPPSDMAEFPRLVEVATIDQGMILDRVNAALAAIGADPIDALPQIYRADRALPATFTELDPYGAHRTGPLTLPLPADFSARAGDGEELFVYGPELLAAEADLWKGLGLSGLKVRVHLPRVSADAADRMRRLGLIMEPEPLPFDLIAERSRLIMSHGGHGMICSGLAAGLPHVVYHYDLEKQLHGVALARAGYGGHVPLKAIKAEVFAESLKRVYADEALAARVRAAAPGFLTRGQAPVEQAVVEAVAELT